MKRPVWLFSMDSDQFYAAPTTTAGLKAYYQQYGQNNADTSIELIHFKDEQAINEWKKHWKKEFFPQAQAALENEVQPVTFHSIRASFWWSVASLTGVGFEEIYPITLGGKIFGSVISIIGIGVVAVPTGIISASFVELIDEHKKEKND